MSADKQAQLREQVSALLDGELSEQEMPLLMKRLEKDPELCQYWQRQSQARDAMRGSAATKVDAGFTASVMAAINETEGSAYSADLDSMDMSSTSRRSRDWMKPVAGFAVAASVAGMAVLGLNTLEQGLGVPGESEQVAFFESASQSSEAGQSGPVWLDQTRIEPFPQEFSLAARNGSASSVTNVDFKASRDHRLNSYLNQHEDQAWLLGVPGDPVPQARGYHQYPSGKNVFDSYYSRPVMLGAHEVAAE